MILGAVLGTLTLFALLAILTVVLPSGSKTIAGETTVQGKGGTWTNVTAERLVEMLAHKDFILVNVRTPYVGEIAGTDLYLPSDQIAARAAQLPGDRSARILVYCKSGVQSRLAAQALLDLGYTHVYNLEGGMDAWTATGRTLVTLDRH